MRLAKGVPQKNGNFGHLLVILNRRVIIAAKEAECCKQIYRRGRALKKIHDAIIVPDASNSRINWKID